MSKPVYVKIEKDGEQGSCLPSALSLWESKGWTSVDDGDSEAPEAPKTDTTTFVVYNEGEAQ